MNISVDRYTRPAAGSIRSSCHKQSQQVTVQVTSNGGTVTSKEERTLLVTVRGLEGQARTK